MNTVKAHPYHLVNPSLLPLLLSAFAIFLITGVISYLHNNILLLNGFIIFITAGILIIFFMSKWWAEVVKESFLLFHTIIVKKGLKVGFALFIVSEIMFFFGFFWAYFYNALSPSIFVGGVWPPFAINPFNPLTLPLANTGILLTSGLTITYAHMFMNINHFKQAKEGILLTICLAVLFIFIQFQEFYHAPFSISDGIYGSTFFMITGLHGFHVIIGMIFILICYIRYQISFLNSENVNVVEPIKSIFNNNGFHETYYFKSREVFTGFVTGSWYWHFVDVVWIYVYIFLYLFSFY
jgi:cytochrome c oxidase subunit 3